MTKKGLIEALPRRGIATDWGIEATVCDKGAVLQGEMPVPTYNLVESIIMHTAHVVSANEAVKM